MQTQTLAAMAITGTPEVDVEVAYVATLTITGWNADYFPITFTVGNETYAIGSALAEGDDLDTTADGKITDTTELIAVVERAIEAKGIAKADKNVSLDGKYDSMVKVSWTGNDTAKDNAIPSEAKINLSIQATVTQK